MFSYKRILLLLFSTVAVWLLSACSAVSSHIDAVTKAIVGYSDYYIEVLNLEDQVKQAYQTIDPNSSVVSYTIDVSIPDYTADEFQSVAFTPPTPDFSTQSASSYQKKAVLSIRQAMETYALNHTGSRSIELPVAFDLVTSGKGWAASLTSSSKLEIQRTVENMMLTLLSRNDSYQQNYRLSLAADELRSLLADAMGGQEYADLVQITDLSQTSDDTVLASLSYPDPTIVFSMLGNTYAASFNQPFYGDELVVSLTADGLREIDTSAIPLVQDRVSIRLDSSSKKYQFSEASSLLERIASAKQQADESAAAQINSLWRIAPADPPASGSVLEGESSGNQIILNTGTSLGKYCYLRFYSISGEDISEEGSLVAGLFLVSGQSAKIRLPSGSYRVSCYVGDNWYGVDQLFGKNGKVYNSKNAIRSMDGYINTISFG